MTPRRHALLVASLLLVTTGCGAEAAGPVPTPTSDRTAVEPAAVEPASVEPAATEPAATEPAEGLPIPATAISDVALIAADGRAVVVRDGIATEPVDGLLAPDRRTLITRTVVAGTTTVRWIGLADGTQAGSVDVPGDLTVVAADLHGEYVALTGSPAADAGGTDLVVVSPEGLAFRRDYDAELLPEGFATTLTEAGLPLWVFVVDYLGPPVDAPEAPRPYRVRVVDLTTGELGLPFNLRDKGQFVDQEMLGYGRSHALSRRDGLLFTLYRGIGTNDFHNAFVHTLGFGNGVWCLDLPNELALDHLPGAITLSDDESRLFVVSGNGLVTEFDVAAVLDLSRDPIAARTVQGWTPADPTVGTAVASRDRTLLVAQGHEVHWLDTTSLVEHASTSTTFDVESLVLGDDGTVVAVGDGVVAQLTPTGEIVASSVLPIGFGPVTSVALLDT